MEMEIDLSGVKKGSLFVWVGIGIIVLLGLMLFGRAVSEEDRLLTWQEWQIQKLKRAYNAERLALLHDIEQLEKLLSDDPDPARAQVVVLGIRRNQSGRRVEALESARQALADAAQAVLDWASGAGEYNAAVDAVQKSRSLVNGAKW